MQPDRAEQEQEGIERSDVESAFLQENSFARQAAEMVGHVIDGPQDPRNPGAAAYLIGAQTLATLALAHEQRETRLDLLGIARGEF